MVTVVQCSFFDVRLMCVSLCVFVCSLVAALGLRPSEDRIQGLCVVCVFWAGMHTGEVPCGVRGRGEIGHRFRCIFFLFPFIDFKGKDWHKLLIYHQLNYIFRPAGFT